MTGCAVIEERIPARVCPRVRHNNKKRKRNNNDTGTRRLLRPIKLLMTGK